MLIEVCRKSYGTQYQVKEHKNLLPSTVIRCELNKNALAKSNLIAVYYSWPQTYHHVAFDFIFLFLL